MAHVVWCDVSKSKQKRCASEIRAVLISVLISPGDLDCFFGWSCLPLDGDDVVDGIVAYLIYFHILSYILPYVILSYLMLSYLILSYLI